MIQNKDAITNLPENIKNIVLDKQIFLGIVIVFFTATSSVLSSKAGLGPFAAWPVFILFLVFIQNYELGLICFVLSFAYESAVFFVPQYGAAAIIRLDEIVFVSIFTVWFLRKTAIRKIKISSGPLLKPLRFYPLIILISLLGHYDQIGSTSFLGTRVTGFVTLVPVLLRLSEVIFGYIILSDTQLSQKVRIKMFWCLLLVAGFAIILSLLAANRFLPINIPSNKYYNPYAWYTRFAFYGNTSAWGVLLSIYFFILFYSLLYFKTLTNKLMIFLFLALCIYALFLSGTKTSMVTIVVSLFLLTLEEKERIGLIIKIFIFTIFIIGASIWGVNRYTTYTQYKGVYSELGQAYTGVGFRGLEKAYKTTSLGGRVDVWSRFLDAVKEEPTLLFFGRGWQSRGAYKTPHLHNDFLTAVHDLGILGGVFIIWLYLAMFMQLKTASIEAISYKNKLLVSVMKVLLIGVFISSFMSENFTFYLGAEVVFPLIIALMAVVWNYLKALSEETG